MVRLPAPLRPLLACATAILFLALVVTAPALAGPDAENGVLRATLENGLRVVVVRNTLAPVAAVQVNYLVGSNEAPAGFPGMAHAQEHMMFRGSPGLSGSQLSYLSALMGGRFDASTDQTVTQYVFTVAAADLDVALRIEAMRMREVVDGEADWRQERGAIEQEVAQDLSNPEYRAYTALLGALFQGTPYAHDALGTRESFQKTTAAMLERFHRDWYAPNNAILVVAGDVDPPRVVADVERLFGPIHSRPLPARPGFTFGPVHATRLDLKSDRPYALAMIAFRVPGYDSADHAAVRVLADVLNSRRGALAALVADGKALDAGFSLSSMPKAGMAYAIVAVPAGQDPGTAIDDVRRILTSAAGGVPADLVEAAKRRATARAEFEKDSVEGLASAWSSALAVQGRTSPADAIRAITQVSPADVDRVARASLDLSRAAVVVLTPQASGQAVASKGFGGKESFRAEHTTAVQLPAWAQKVITRLEVPESARQPTVTTLPNGLTLIVQPESVSDTVGVYGRVKQAAGLQVPAGQEGVDQVLDRLFGFGSTSRDRVAYQRALDEIGAEESAGSDFSLEVLAAHFERGVELLADNELRPALAEPAFGIVKQQVASAVAGQLESPDYKAGRALTKALFPPGDPSLREATPATVNRLTLEDVKGYHRSAFRPDLTTIVVIGRVTPERATEVITRHFGAWAATGPRPETVLPRVPPSRAASLTVPNPSRVQDKVVMAETLEIDRFHPDYYALQLGNHVLGGAFYSTRLYHDLRERDGLVYYVASTIEAREQRAVYAVEYGSDPASVGRAAALVRRNLEAMRTAPASADELRQAKALLLREIPLSESSLDDIAAGFLGRQTLGLPLDEPVRAARRYLALGADDVRAAFARWLRVDDLAVVTEGPPPP
jgi:zinc protease